MPYIIELFIAAPNGSTVVTLSASTWEGVEKAIRPYTGEHGFSDDVPAHKIVIYSVKEKHRVEKGS